jgi:hypothetical protein
MAKLYPVKNTVEVYITDGDQVGSVSYGMGMGRLPTDEEMPSILDKVKVMLPDGFRLMTRHEATMHFLREEKGYRGPNLAPPALADGDEWFDPATADGFSMLGDEPDDEDEE